MTKSLRLLTIVFTLALLGPCTAWSQQHHQGTNAGTLIDEVLAQLQRHNSIKANVLLRGMLGGRTLACDDPLNPGTYYQVWDASREKLSVKLHIQGYIEDTPVRFLQVSSGDRLWTDFQLPKGRHVTDVDLRQIRRHGKFTEAESAKLPAGAATVLPMQTELSAEQGGLPALVASLKENFVFSPPVRLELSNVPVLGMIGHWKKDKLDTLLPPVESEEEELEQAQWPEHIPASVLVVVGRKDFFPYIVEFRREQGQVNHSPGDLSAYQLQPHPLMFLHLYQRDLNVQIPNAEFQYVLGDAESHDLTAERLERLQRIKQRRVARLGQGARQ